MAGNWEGIYQKPIFNRIDRILTLLLSVKCAVFMLTLNDNWMSVTISFSMEINRFEKSITIGCNII